MGCSITAVEQKNEEGQSLIEFLLMLPLLIGLTIILIRVNSAIQVSIVDQQYARAQTFFLSFNNSVYPELKTRTKFASSGVNEMIMGVAGNLAQEDAPDRFQPESSTQNITRRKLASSNDQPQQEPDQRANVHIRDTVALCVPDTYVKAGGTPVSLVPLVSSQLLAETVQFDYCGSPFNEQ